MAAKVIPMPSANKKMWENEVSVYRYIYTWWKLIFGSDNGINSLQDTQPSQYSTTSWCGF